MQHPESNHITFSYRTRRKQKNSCIKIVSLKKKSLQIEQPSSFQVPFFWRFQSTLQSLSSSFVGLLETISGLSMALICTLGNSSYARLFWTMTYIELLPDAEFSRISSHVHILRVLSGVHLSGIKAKKDHQTKAKVVPNERLFDYVYRAESVDLMLLKISKTWVLPVHLEGLS